jgi:hypothetical protein
MCNQEILVELLINGVLLIYLDREVLTELLKHFLQNLELHLVNSGKDLNSNCFVDRKHFLEDRASVSGDDSSSLLVLTLLEINSGKSHQVLVENLRALLLCEVEAVFPLSTLLEHIQA